MMKIKIGVLFFSFLYLQNMLVAQDFVKYIFEKNKIKVVVPVEMKEIQDNVLKQEFEGLTLIKEWETEKGTPKMQAFILTDSLNTEPISLTVFFEKMNSKESSKSLKSGTRKINNQKIVSYEELIIGDSKSGNFACIFTAMLDDNRQLLFYYTCPARQMKKNATILNEIIRTLTVN